MFRFLRALCKFLIRVFCHLFWSWLSSFHSIITVVLNMRRCGALLLRRLFSSLRICSNQAFNRTIFYNRKFGSAKLAFLNGHILETNKDTIAPNSARLPWDQGLSSTLSRKWSSLTLSPSFGLFYPKRPGYAPRTPFDEQKKLQVRQKGARKCKICELFNFGPFSHFHSDRMKTHVPSFPEVLDKK